MLLRVPAMAAGIPRRPSNRIQALAQHQYKSGLERKTGMNIPFFILISPFMFFRRQMGIMSVLVVPQSVIGEVFKKNKEIKKRGKKESFTA
jgi:hypothetical protein